MSDASATNEDPKSTLSYRLARAAVIILGVLLVVALVMLVVGVALRLSGHKTIAERASAPTVMTLPPDARIVSVDTQPGRLVLRLRTPEGEEIDIVDTESGRLVSQIKSAGGAGK